MAPDSRRREDAFSWLRRNWQFVSAIAAIAFVAVGAYFRLGFLEDRLTANETRDTAQWQRIGDVDDKVDGLRDRVSRMEGHH